MNSFQVIGAWTGLIGGFSGFIALMFQSRQLYLGYPRIKNQISWAINPSTEKEYFSVEIINKSGKSVQLNNLSILFTNSNHSPFSLYPDNEKIGRNFPVVLDSFASENWLVSKEATISAIKQQNANLKITAQVNLATGKKIKSNTLQIKI
jgi:hypothetical protein